jgi:hypothetical protein
MKLYRTLCLALILPACEESEIQEPDGLAEIVAQSLEARGLPTDSVSVTEQVSGGSSTHPGLSLCQLAWSYNGDAGVYRVQELVSTRETPETLGDIFTYAYLVGETLDGESSELVIRVTGGTLTDPPLGQTGLLSLRTGQELVFFTSAPDPEVNQGFPLAFEWTTMPIDPDGSVGTSIERWESLTALAESYAREVANPPMDSETRNTSDASQYARLAESCGARE